MGIPVIGFVGFSGVGKTTLLTKVISKLRASGYRIAVIKHSHHHFDIDHKGKDSYRYREAGANQVIVGSKRRYALMVELTNDAAEPNLKTLINQLNLSQLDFVFYEGFMHEAFAKIEVHREELNHPLLYPNNEWIVALATNQPNPKSSFVEFDIDDVESIIDFILGFVVE